MPGARPVGYPEIGRDTDQSDVDVGECSRKRGAHEGGDLGKARLPHRVVRPAVAEGRSLVVLGAHGEYASRFRRTALSQCAPVWRVEPRETRSGRKWAC